MNKITARYLLLVLLIVADGLFLDRFSPTNQASVSLSQQQKSTTLSIKGVQILVTVAATDAERIQGLSGRPSLGEGEGELFIFDAPARPGFWMKEMRFPIDIVWIDSDKKISQITPNVAPETYPRAFYPDSPVRYVLEVNAGWATRHSLAVGDQASW